MSPRFPCIECRKPVARTHYALECSGCKLWQHIGCGTGATKAAYKAAAKAQEEVEWTCKACLMHEPPSLQEDHAAAPSVKRKRKTKATSPVPPPPAKRKKNAPKPLTTDVSPDPRLRYWPVLETMLPPPLEDITLSPTPGFPPKPFMPKDCTCGPPPGFADSFSSPHSTPVVTPQPQSMPVVTGQPHSTPVVAAQPHSTPVVAAKPHSTPVVTAKPPSSFDTPRGRSPPPMSFDTSRGPLPPPSPPSPHASTSTSASLAPLVDSPVFGPYVRPNIILENSLEGPAPLELSATEDSLTYTIVVGGSQKGKDKLVDSDGFSFVKHKGKENYTLWRCSRRSKALRCSATVTQRGDIYTRGPSLHNHDPTPGANIEVAVSATIKRRAQENLYEPPRQIVEETLLQLVEPGVPNTAIPALSNFVRRGRRARFGRLP